MTTPNGVGKSGKSVAPRIFELTQWISARSLEPVKQQVDAWLQGSPRDRVLDICCGTGAFADLAPAEYLGVDLDAGAIALAAERRGRDPRKRFEVNDVSVLQVEPQSWDVVIFANGLHHMSDDAALATLAIAKKAAKGPIIVIDPALETRALGSQILFALERGEYLRYLDDQRALLTRAGFVIEKCTALYSGLAHQRIFFCRVA